MIESESGQMVLKKVKLTYFDAYDILSEQGYTSLPRRYQKSDALQDPH